MRLRVSADQAAVRSEHHNRVVDLLPAQFRKAHGEYPGPVRIFLPAFPKLLVRSWSGDGKKLAGEWRRDDGSPSGIGVYSFERGNFDQLTESGIYPYWLSDSRRLLFVDQGKLYLVDSISKKVREVLSVAPHEVTRFRCVTSRDYRTVYFSQFQPDEADIWLATLQ